MLEECLKATRVIKKLQIFWKGRKRKLLFMCLALIGAKLCAYSEEKTYDINNNKDEKQEEQNVANTHFSILAGINATIKDDGSVYVWGNDMAKSLSNTKSLTDVVSVSVGGTHIAAITEDGSLYMRGNNEDGILGVDSYEENKDEENSNKYYYAPVKLDIK